MSERYNPELYNLVKSLLSKEAFVPATPGAGGPPGMGPGGPPPGGDPSMGGPPPDMGPGGDPSAGAPPMPPAGVDPASMGMATGTPPPMDPSMGMPPPPAPPAPQPDAVKDQIKEVLQETGVIKAPKLSPQEQFQHVVDCLQAIGNAIGVQLPKPPTSSEGKPKKDDPQSNPESQPLGSPSSLPMGGSINDGQGITGQLPPPDQNVKQAKDRFARLREMMKSKQ